MFEINFEMASPFFDSLYVKDLRILLGLTPDQYSAFFILKAFKDFLSVYS